MAIFKLSRQVIENTLRTERHKVIVDLRDIAQQIATLKSRLIALDRERSEIVEKLASLERDLVAEEAVVTNPQRDTRLVTMASPTADKIALFRSLFRGREDVLPRRWENVKTGKAGYAPMCRNEWVQGICRKPLVKCGECKNQAFIPLSEDILHSHLAGKASGAAADFTIGIYPMLPDETCWFLAADFDKKSWIHDITAFRDTARAKSIPIAIERSRSGNGGHAWIFFTEPVPAAEARRLGMLLVTATMERYPDIGFDSYDRFFPSQDTMPAGGFGNLIALPLQNRPREKGNSAFLNDDLYPYDDQWTYLSTIGRMSPQALASIVSEAAATGQIIGVRLPVTEEDDEPWAALPSRRNKEIAIEGVLPKVVEIILGNQIFIDRSNLPPALV